MLNPSHVSCPGRRGPRVHQVLSRSACPRPETCSCRGPTSPRVGSPSPWLAEHIEKPESLHLRPQGPHTSIPGSAGPQPPCGPLRLPVTPAVGLLCPIAHQAPAATRGAQPAVTQPGRNVFFGTGPEELALALPLHTCESRPAALVCHLPGVRRGPWAPWGPRCAQPGWSSRARGAAFIGLTVTPEKWSEQRNSRRLCQRPSRLLSGDFKIRQTKR